MEDETLSFWSNICLSSKKLQEIFFDIKKTFKKYTLVPYIEFMQSQIMGYIRTTAIMGYQQLT